jgi:hypothetical protein
MTEDDFKIVPCGSCAVHEPDSPPPLVVQKTAIAELSRTTHARGGCGGLEKGRHEMKFRSGLVRMKYLAAAWALAVIGITGTANADIVTISGGPLTPGGIYQLNGVPQEGVGGGRTL